MPVFLKETNNKLYLKAFIEKNNIDIAIKNLMSFLNLEERNNYYIITEKLFDNNIKDLLDQLFKIPSLIMAGPSIESGKLIIRFRPYHNYSKNVSNALSLKIMKPLFIDK